MKGKKNSRYYFIWAGLVALIVLLLIIIIVIVISRNNGTEPTAEAPVESSLGTLTTEEEKEVTQQVMDKYVEIEVEGYQNLEGEYGLNDVVEIRLKNISNERANLTLDILALDDAENALDQTSIYAEGIEPGQEQVFYAFELSELTPEQLKNAHYKVLRANTYSADETQENETITEEEPAQE